ncbi:hypothetical protein ACQCX5_08020 [Propionibacteriaceae bacterium G57]|uniref:hypothetical protein n=1 Tax=Aestuariimicrobium sp. G57 TaxID=3418485 RepID=UPI003DA75CD9
MRLFTDHDAPELGNYRKWQRVGLALELRGRLQPGVAYSLGDSGTFRLTSAAGLVRGELVGHRRYLPVLACLRGHLDVEVGRTDDLVALGDYDDTTDRQYFTGSGRIVRVLAGGLLAISTDEAYRVVGPAEDDVEVMVLHVTVEGPSFPLVDPAERPEMVARPV